MIFPLDRLEEDPTETMPARILRPSPRFAHESALGLPSRSAARIVPGERIAIEMDGPVKHEAAAANRFAMAGPLQGPLWGPIDVAGAAPGDALVVRIAAIDPADQRTAWSPETARNDPPARYWVFGGDGGNGWHERWEGGWPPFLRPLGTAPAPGPRTAGPEEICVRSPHAIAGATVLLPVRHPRAGFYVGPVHAVPPAMSFPAATRQIAARVTLDVDLLPAANLSAVRIETPFAFLAVARAASSDDAARLAYADLAEWLAPAPARGAAETRRLLAAAVSLHPGALDGRGCCLVALCPKAALPATARPVHVPQR